MDRIEELLSITNQITKEYESLLPLLRDPEVSKAVSFLTELDSLSEQYEFTAIDIVRLIDPGRAEAMQAIASTKANSSRS
ncbi:hypothetical protein [Pseudomonas sp. BP8]|uniref:hypothetical protein n=1 Tax=Pseudomonas sp. BP8 TaxID=2817864 RepID=UPI001AEB6C61|nr:hypothetical protein [Pseudomonas sp. BP8]MBP2262272.1 cupin superfamily acireductone dioxygenase involved in methionine salvage [Pseudomonas sp. BP8]HDS1733196.1 hypothetical protein [Pseudomonas putida]